MTFKEKVHARYLQMALDKVDVFRDRISALAEDARNDAKGSAGDKHETALSMMQIEQEKLSVKLRECLAELEALQRVDPAKASGKAALGSLICTSGNRNFYLLQAMPKIEIDGSVVFALSPNSPLGQQLFGADVGKPIKIGEADAVIETIL